MTWLLIALIAGAWAAQTWFAWRQSQAFLAEVARLRRRGRVAVGRGGGRRIGRAAFAAVAADSSQRVVEVVVLTGITVWARPRTRSTWDGEPLQQLLPAREEDDRVTRAVAEAARILAAPDQEDPADDDLVEEPTAADRMPSVSSEHHG